MNFEHALARLRNHANMDARLPEAESFLFALWQSERQGQSPKLQPLFDDIIECLEVVNVAFNTKTPSETIAGKVESLPRPLVADVSVILSEGWAYHCRWTCNHRFDPDVLRDCATALAQIGIAWNAVLAGDIDNVREQIKTEFSAWKGFHTGSG